ncbi:MAG: alpha/beta hydrolase [Sulfurovum sp.]|nr:MAG: alpha/beta hydrolase [Sulfurovum sp.]
MRYFNGFALQNEEHFFKEYIVKSDFTVAGFSYGAQKAFEYAYASCERIDRLILLSPAFFQNQKSSFIRTQLRYFKADQDAYTQQFLKNISFPSAVSLDEHLKGGTYEELEDLLGYVWDRDKMLALQERGVEIEVFLGGRDKIVLTEKSLEFFSDVTTTYFFKELGHLLC